MTPDRLRTDLAAAAYLAALDRDDPDEQARLWRQAATDPALAAALREVHAGLLEEATAAEEVAARAAVARAAEMHLTSGEVIRPAGPVTVGDVADDLFRHTPDRLPPEAHTLNATLRASAEPLPADLGLSKLTAWAEAKFGPAPPGYWKAFHAAAMRLELRQASAVEYQLAARTAPRPGGRK